MVGNDFPELPIHVAAWLWLVFLIFGLASHARGSALLLRAVLSWFLEFKATRRRRNKRDTPLL